MEFYHYTINKIIKKIKIKLNNSVTLYEAVIVMFNLTS